MNLIFNNTNIKKVIYNNTAIAKIIYNSSEIFTDLSVDYSLKILSTNSTNPCGNSYYSTTEQATFLKSNYRCFLIKNDNSEYIDVTDSCSFSIVDGTILNVPKTDTVIVTGDSKTQVALLTVNYKSLSDSIPIYIQDYYDQSSTGGSYYFIYKEPNKTTFTVGDKLDVTGIVILCDNPNYPKNPTDDKTNICSFIPKINSVLSSSNNEVIIYCPSINGDYFSELKYSITVK